MFTTLFLGNVSPGVASDFSPHYLASESAFQKLRGFSQELRTFTVLTELHERALAQEPGFSLVPGRVHLTQDFPDIGPLVKGTALEDASFEIKEGGVLVTAALDANPVRFLVSSYPEPASIQTEGPFGDGVYVNILDPSARKPAAQGDGVGDPENEVILKRNHRLAMFLAERDWDRVAQALGRVVLWQYHVLYSVDWQELDTFLNDDDVKVRAAVAYGLGFVQHRNLHRVQAEVNKAVRLLLQRARIEESDVVIYIIHNSLYYLKHFAVPIPVVPATPEIISTLTELEQLQREIVDRVEGDGLMEVARGDGMTEAGAPADSFNDLAWILSWGVSQIKDKAYAVADGKLLFSSGAGGEGEVGYKRTMRHLSQRDIKICEQLYVYWLTYNVDPHAVVVLLRNMPEDLKHENITASTEGDIWRMLARAAEQHPDFQSKNLGSANKELVFLQKMVARSEPAAPQSGDGVISVASHLLEPVPPYVLVSADEVVAAVSAESGAQRSPVPALELIREAAARRGILLGEGDVKPRKALNVVAVGVESVALIQALRAQGLIELEHVAAALPKASSGLREELKRQGCDILELEDVALENRIRVARVEEYLSRIWKGETLHYVISDPGYVPDPDPKYRRIISISVDHIKHVLEGGLAVIRDAATREEVEQAAQILADFSA
ncbi:MAG: hypothetical protein HYY14_07270 [Candidatus Omnitrophica bacterium]|nr:hypothetical protein [Candidatus Omnitrophota bacterium]